MNLDLGLGQVSSGHDLGLQKIREIGPSQDHARDPDPIQIETKITLNKKSINSTPIMK